jgi:DNA-binding response OmpR family regulator
MGTVDAALLDLQIDDEYSYDVGRRLDKLHVPWAITTAHPPSFVGPQFSHVALLSKPFNIADLLNLIEKLLDGPARIDQSEQWARGR